jgi:murein DD-endopeptidase MepM/ murein hydrolase activator NlpD
VERVEPRLTLPEILGLTPWRDRLRETVLTLRGDATTPPTRFDHTSLRILAPALALAMWRGRRPFGRRAPVYNLFNHRPTPIAEGWSVRKTQVEDFRGGTLTYDSHNGTDFATPPGTVVVAPAAGRVAVVVSDFRRGGLKIMLDHGDGLATTAGHLGRALVGIGDPVEAGQPIALSGASGINFVGSLLADPPHVHMNVWLDGVPVDPFARAGERALWREGNAPTPGGGGGEAYRPAVFDDARVRAWIDGCRDRAIAAELAAIEDPWRRGCATIFAANYYPTRWASPVEARPYADAHERAGRLDLPFGAEDYDGIALD